LLAGAAGQAAAVTGYDSAYFGESAFLTLGPSQTGQFAVGFNNTGSTGWLTGSTSQVDLAICLADKTTCGVTSPNAAFASGWLSSTAYATTSTTYVGPGQTGYFVYNVAVPSNAAPGTYRFNGDLALHGTASMIHQDGYYQDVQVPLVGAPAKLACSLTPTSIVAGSSQTAVLTVTVVDAAGTPVTTQNTFSITVSQAGTTTTINAPNPAIVTNGVATFTVNAPAAGAAGGTDQLSAAGTPLTPASVLQGCLANLAFTSPGAPAGLKITAPTQSQYPAGTQTNTTATAGFVDSAGVATTTTAASTTVTFSVDNSTICYITTTAGTTSANVVVAAGATGANIAFTMTGVPGSCTLTASSTGLTSGSKTFSTVAAGPAAQVAITANTCTNTPTTANTPGSTCAITVQVQDAAGNPVFANNSITLSLTKSGSSCAATFGASTPAGTATAAPNATATALTGTGSTVKFVLQDAVAESCTATATSGALTSAATTASFTGFGPATLLTLRPTASTIPANGVATATLTACVRDASSNIVTSANGDSVTLTVNYGTDGANSTVISANPATTASGCASFTVQSTIVSGTDTYQAIDTTRTFTSNTATLFAQ
jgi:hypothetical protein